MSSGPIRILVYDDNPNLRLSIETMLQWSEEFLVVGSYPDGSHVVEDVRRHSPDVILMDIDMPPVNGIEALRMLRPHEPDLPVIMLTVFDDNDHIIDAICAGASGYLLKKDVDQLIPSVRDVLNGGAPLTSSVARKVLKCFPPAPTGNDDTLNLLTPREREILDYVVKGFSYKMIAAELFLGVDTVRTHVKKIYKKLQVNSAREAAYKVSHLRI